jgi:tRNA pseudouridine13 synthase
MRIKVTPDDFRVRELLEFRPDPGGEHYVHLLQKEKLSTQEALSRLCMVGEIDRSSVAYAGLKDRQGITEQHISIAGRAFEWREPGLRLTPLGRAANPINSRMSRGNAFTIVVRDLEPFEAAKVRRNLPSLQKTGFPNYFDDQRFGCLRHGQGFPMLQVLRGDYASALRQLIAEPSPRAITGDVRLKTALQKLWGDWEACLRTARGPVYEPMFEHLCANPQDFRGALEFLPLRIRVIQSFAYQSFLWNRAVSLMLRGGVNSAQRLRITTLAGDLLAWKYLEPEREQKLMAMETPLFGPEGTGGSEPFKNAMREELENAGLYPSNFTDNQVPGMIWREEPRQVFIKPKDMAEARLEPDEIHDGRVKATLSFSLPRGAYATMLLKRLFAPPFYSEDGDRRARGGGRPEGERSYGGARYQGRSEDRGDSGSSMQRGPARPQRDDRGPARPYEKRPATPWESGMDEDFDA